MRIIPRTRGGALWRFCLGAVVVIGATAAATAVAGLLQFKQLALDLSATPALRGADVTLPNPGEPQTILIIGSDHRAGTPFNAAHTDTMLLVRLNARSQTINVVSVPRDLKVQIPGDGTDKLNAAYSIGGPNLLLKVLKQQVFPGLHVNHVIDVNFGGFIALVNAIHCVYSDVDHRYYNNTALTDYSSINIQPGYQRLCGFHALQFVRFRHTDSDLVRNARQQDFIRWAKDQYGTANIVSNRDKLLHIFGAHTRTDPNLHTADGIENLFVLVAFSAGHTIKQIRFPAIQSTCTVQSCYLTAQRAAEAGVFRAFMRPTLGPAAAKSAGSPGQSRKRSSRIATAGLTSDVADGKVQAAALRGVGMPVYFPRLIVSGSNYCSSLTSLCPLEIPSPGSYPRAYTIKDQQGRPHAAYRMTIVINAPLGEYYGVQGTTWPHPPILASPSQTRTVAGKQLLLYVQGSKITDVAWHTPQGVYWISNTLTTDISNHEMIGIAASLTQGGA